MKRLALLLLAPLLLAADFAPVRPGVPMRFPADHGAHPGFRTEWWYVTGWLRPKSATGARDMGIQITFFRTRVPRAVTNASRFATEQVIFAHAAIADPATGRLRHATRIARAGFGLAQAHVGDMDVAVDDWRLWRGRDGRLRGQVVVDGQRLDLAFTPRQPVILQGQGGYSQKGPSPSEASHYYSWPGLSISGSLAGQPVAGTAWLDREWSSTLLNPRAVGWDWLGLNLADGAALTLFRVRDAQGRPVWAGGSHRDSRGKTVIFQPQDVDWQAAGWWTSPRSGARWPVRPLVRYRLGGQWQRLEITPLMPDQELDSRAGGGPLYWEGAVSAPGARGYLELTGYAAPLRM
ncbi:MAG: carotenoid 1,2-hydratase [Alphaproteobacteria bacterium]|nr:carotenoid 1,2-hydratase [Alphaproteobacteria bacterium]